VVVRGYMALEGADTEEQSGYDGIKIWDLKTLKELDVPQQSPNERGQVSCVFWITRENEAFESLVYGNGIGYLVFLQYRATEVGVQLTYLHDVLSFASRIALRQFIPVGLAEEARS